MRKIELEQCMLNNEKRILELGERLFLLEKENQELQKKNQELQEKNQELQSRFNDENNSISNGLKNLSDELYKFIDKQNHQIVEYNDTRISALSNELYQFIGEQNQCLGENNSNRLSELSNEVYQFISEQNHQLGERMSTMNSEIWMRTFGFDNMIATLQLNAIEQIYKGNREKLMNLKDTHVGEKCFVIGNGPSLTAHDLDILKEKRVFCFASKGIYNIFDETDWRPDVWAASDLDWLELKQDDVNNLTGFPKLICAQAVINRGLKFNDVLFYPFIQAERHPAFFNKDILRGVHFYGTITGKLISIASFMGFTEIYLLGCDNTVPTTVDENGKVVVDNTKELHFSNKYYKDEKEREYAYKNTDNILEALKYIDNSFKDIRFNCELIGVQIYNATRGGELEVFDRADFDDTVREW